LRILLKAKLTEILGETLYGTQVDRDVTQWQAFRKMGKNLGAKSRKKYVDKLTAINCKSPTTR
jgi:hypothetical protein